MKKTRQFVIAFLFLGAIAVAGVLVNQPDKPSIPQEMPILSASCETSPGQSFHIQTALLGYHWLETDKNGNQQWKTQDFIDAEILDGILSPTDGKIELRLLRPGEPSEILITRYEDYYFDLTALGLPCSDGEPINAEWTQWEELLICEIPAVESSIYIVTVHYGESHASFGFGTERPDKTTRIGYIGIPEGGAKGALRIDPVEWITLEDSERIAQLGLNPDEDMSGGFYIYNPVAEDLELSADEDTLFRIIGADGINPVFVGWDEFTAFVDRYRSQTGRDPLCRIQEGENGALILVSEQYLP